jgi:hypothetical protein
MMHLLFISMTIAAIVTGCGTSPHSSQRQIPPSNTFVPTTQPEEIPMVCYPAGIPPLDPDQLREVVADVEKIRSPGDRIWFVQVIDNHQGYRVAVRFIPDKQTPRMRSGKSLFIEGAFRKYREKYAEQIGVPYVPEPRRYVQISDVSSVFSKELTIPEPRLLPFEPPAGLDDEDLIAIIDCARKALADVEVAPILRINRDGDGFRVYTGQQRGMLDGRGNAVKVIRTREGFKAIEIEMWVS